MLRFDTERQIAIFDVDGVIVENPPEAMKGGPPIQDHDFWQKHWLHPENGKIQEEMVTLAQSLISTGVHVIFMTARPEIYRKCTVQLLRRAGFMVHMVSLGIVDAMSTRPELVMMPGGEILNSAAWKQGLVGQWKATGAKIMLFVEDYKWNCEAIRAFCPVLLYERQKISRHQGSNFPCCGGLAACWCLTDRSNNGIDFKTTSQVGGSSGSVGT